MQNQKLFKKFSSMKIMVIGDIMLDRYFIGCVNRVSPEAPVPVILNKNETCRPGGAANVVRNLLGLGIQTCLVGVTGMDESGAVIRSILEKEERLNISGVFPVSDRPTTQKLRIIGNNQQIARVDTESSELLNSSVNNKIRHFIQLHMPDTDAVILSDYGKGVISKGLIQYILKQRKELSFTVAVDPKVGHFFYYKGVDLITPNNKEASEASSQTISDSSSLKYAADNILKKLSCKNLLITLGPEGMILFNKNYKKGYHIPTEAKKVYDVTGAGDTVISVMTAAMAAGAQPQKAARLANRAAGLVVGEVGTTAIKLERLIDPPPA